MFALAEEKEGKRKGRERGGENQSIMFAMR